MIKNRLLSVIGLIALLPVWAYANCPSTNEVTYKCLSVAGKTHCSYSAYWWEGYPELQGDHPAHPASFHHAFWGTKKLLDSRLGSVVCFYQAEDGTFLMLSQNKWGGVKRPDPRLLGTKWREGVWASPQGVLQGYVCDAGAAECNFNYPVK